MSLKYSSFLIRREAKRKTLRFTIHNSLTCGRKSALSFKLHKFVILAPFRAPSVAPMLNNPPELYLQGAQLCA